MVGKERVVTVKAVEYKTVAECHRGSAWPCSVTGNIKQSSYKIKGHKCSA